MRTRSGVVTTEIEHRSGPNSGAVTGGGLLLLTPGPTNVPVSVWQALQKGDMCHKQRAVRHALYATNAGMLRFLGLGEGHVALMLGCSGTGACESMIHLLPPGRLGVVVNGRYSARLAEMAARIRPGDVRVLNCEIHSGVSPEAVSRFLRAERLKSLLGTHHETQFGVLNDSGAIANLCAEYGVLLALDGVSGVGAHPFPLRPEHPAVIAFSANKGIEGLPGVSWIVSHRQNLTTTSAKPSSVYLDPFVHFEAQTRAEAAFTPPVPLVFAAQEAVRLATAEGYSARVSRYARRTLAFRDALRAETGTDLMHPSCKESNVVTVLNLGSRELVGKAIVRLRRAGYYAHTDPDLRARGLLSIGLMGTLTIPQVCEVASTLASGYRRG